MEQQEEAENSKLEVEVEEVELDMDLEVDLEADLEEEEEKKEKKGKKHTHKKGKGGDIMPGVYSKPTLSSTDLSQIKKIVLGMIKLLFKTVVNFVQRHKKLNLAKRLMLSL